MKTVLSSLTMKSFGIGLSFFLLFVLTNEGWAQFNISAGSTNYTQNFNSMTNGTWTNNSTLTGWYARTTATASITAYAAGSGSSTTAAFYAFGTAGVNPLTDRALGFVTSNAYTGTAGSGSNFMGWRLKNNTGSEITSITITYTGEQWRRNDNANSQTLLVAYQTGTTMTDLTAGTWTSIPALTFTSPITGTGTAALDGNALANRVADISTTITVTIAAGDEIMIRWADLNDSANDHTLTIDDVTVNATVAASAEPDIDLGNANGTQVAAADVLQGTNDHVISTFQFYVSDADATLEEAYFATSGDYQSGDISSFKLWSSETNDIGTATQIGSTFASTSSGSGDLLEFTGMSLEIPDDVIAYFWITGNVAAGATPGRTISVDEIAGADFEFTDGTATGTADESGVQTIITNATPSLSAGTLTDFGNVCVNTTSSENSFTLSGSNLNGSNVSISGNAAYTFAISSGGSFSNPLTLTAYDGTSPGTIYVLFNPTTATSYDGNIAISGGGASSINVAVTGSATNGTVGITTTAATAITTTGANSGGSAVSTSCGTITNKGVVWATSANPTIALNLGMTDDGPVASGYSSVISGLTPNTIYNYRAYATNSNGITNYGSNLTFTTVSLPATSPNAGTATSNGFTPSWTAPTGQGGASFTYTVEVHANNTFTALVGSPITGISGTSTVISTLSQNTLYYYRVAVVNAGGTSAWANYTTGITTLVGPCMNEDFVSFTDWVDTGTAADNTHCAPNDECRALGSGDNLVSPPVDYPLSLSFIQDASSGGNGSTATIDYRIGVGGTWLPCHSFTVSTTDSEINVDLTDIGGVDLNQHTQVYFRFNSSFNTWYIDDVIVMCDEPTPTPQMSISGNSQAITEGDTTPSLADHTDFGNVDVAGGTVTRTFTIFNNGTADLEDLMVFIDGGSGVFTVTDQPDGTVAPSMSTTFQITFDPSSTGLATATVLVENNDPNYTLDGFEFDVQGTGVNNANSDIIANGSFTYASNIDYTQYQAATITNTSHSVGAFGFTIRDGGASAADTDGLGTELTAITFNVAGIANIRSAALFDGNTMVNNAPVIGGSTIAFSGLSGSNFTAANNATKNLTLRISYLTTVTDNQQLSFTIQSASASASGSVFATGNAGGAASSTTGDRNRIEVTADRIGFVQQPTNTGISGTMSPAVTVEGKDINNNRDLDYTGSISITSTGTLTGSPVASSASSGLASYGSLVHTVSETGRQLTATSTGLTFSNTATSSLFDITSIAYVEGDYRTVGSGSWVSNSASPAIWQRLIGGVWTANNSPTYATTNAIYVQNLHTLSTGGSFASGVKINIMSGGTFSCGHSSTAASIHVYDGGVLNINANLTVASGGTFEVDDNGTVNANFAYSNPTTSIWQGTENFHPNSNLVIQNWNDAQALFTTANITANTYNSFTAAFGNININSSTLADNWVMISAATSVNLCHGNFTLTNSNTRTVRIASAGVTTTIGGNVVKNASSTLDFCNSGTSSVTVNGNLTVNAGTARLQSNSPSTATININGNVGINGTSTLFVNQNGGSGVLNFNVRGNFTAVAGTTITNTDTDGSFINFNGTALQSINSAVPFGGGIGINIASGANVQLVGNNLQLNGGSRFTLQTGGTFNFNFANDGTTALLVTQPGSPSGTNTFASEQASTLKITSPDGIVATVTANLGNVQLPVSNKTFNNTATFHYIGKANQVMGNAISTGSNGKVVIVELDNNSLTLTPSNNIQISSGPTVDPVGGGRLDIRQGIFVETPTTMVSGSGRLVMTGGTFRSSVLSTTLPQLSGYSTYSLTGGTVELNGNGDQVLSGQPNGGYFNLAVTNSGNKTITSGFVIANNLNITAGTLDFASNTVGGNAGITMTGGRLRMSKVSTSLPELDGIATPYSLTGGTIELYGTSATQQHSLRTRYSSSPSLPISYFNVDINAAVANVQAGSDGANVVASIGNFSVQGAFNINSPACFRLSSAHTVTGGGSFNVNAGATLKYGGTIDASGATGSIQTNTRNFSSMASYGFVGNSSPQVAGTGLPAAVVNLYMDKTDFSNLVQIGADITVNGTLQVYNGIASLGNNKVIIPETGSIMGASTSTGWVSGALQRHVAVSAANRIFEIGTNGTYLPVNINYSNVVVAGNMTVSMNTPDHPQIVSASDLNAGLSINRYWSISQTGITMDHYSPTFAFANFDKDAGVSWGLLNAGLYNGVAWSYPVIGGRTANTTQLLNVSSYGAFVLAHNNTPPPANDNPQFSNPSLTSAAYVYPNCYQLSGSTVGATVNIATGERDVWFQFTAAYSGISVQTNSNQIDSKIYLFSSSDLTTPLDVEDAVVGTGTEIMNFVGLTPGNAYRLAIAAVDENDGAFNVCLQGLRPANCGSTGPFNLCSAFLASPTGATNTTFTFTQGANPPTSVTSTGLIVLSNPALQLAYNTTYTVGLTANYHLQNGAGTPELIQIPNPNACSVTISNHPLVEVKSNMRCSNGATLYRSSYLIGATITGTNICGITGYRVEFTPVSNCAGDNPQSLETFTRVIAGSTASISLSYAFNHIPLAGNPNIGHWSVRWRPLYNGLEGTYGPARVIAVNGTAPASIMQEPSSDAIASNPMSEISFGLYPNPNIGELVNLNLTGVTSDQVFVRIMDAMGRVVYINRYTVEGSLNTVVNFNKPLTSGLYLVEFTEGNNVITQRMMVTR